MPEDIQELKSYLENMRGQCILGQCCADLDVHDMTVLLTMIDKYEKQQREIEELKTGKQFAVYDSVYEEMNFHGSYDSALKEYEGAKDDILGNDLTGDEAVYIFEVKKSAHLVEDKERKDDPKEHGYDFWVKWDDN